MSENIIPAKPHESWVFNKESNTWVAPVAIPSDSKNYYWDEDSKNWITNGLQETNKEVE